MITPSNGQMCHSIDVRNPRRDTGFGTLVPAFFCFFPVGRREQRCPRPFGFFSFVGAASAAMPSWVSSFFVGAAEAAMLSPFVGGTLVPMLLFLLRLHSRRPTRIPAFSTRIPASGFLFLTPGILPFAPSGPASLFAPLLRRSACPRESNQRERHPKRERPPGILPSRSAVGGRLRRQHIPVLTAQ
jgi:hypothetical protein